MNSSYSILTSYELRHLPAHLGAAECWDELEGLLTDLFFLEAKAEAGIVFGLAEDFSAAASGMPAHRPLRRILQLLDEALRRDMHFIARHPTTLFQCFWNACWWYDCPIAPKYYVPPEGGWREVPPWDLSGPFLHAILESWHRAKQRLSPGFCWVRALRPPPLHLGTAQRIVLRGHDSPVTSVSLASDGRRLASGTYDGTVQLWDAETGELLRVLLKPQKRVEDLVRGPFDPEPPKWAGAYARVAFSPDGQRLVSGSCDRTVRVWNADTGELLRVMNGHENTVQCVAFFPDGKRVISGSSDETVRFWDAETGELLRTLSDPGKAMQKVAVSPDGQRIVTGSDQGKWQSGDRAPATVRIWDAQTGQALRTFGVDGDPVSGVAFSPDGQRIASSAAQTVRVWDVGTERELWKVVLYGSHHVAGVNFSRNGLWVVAGCGKSVQILNAESGEPLRVLHGHEADVWSVALSPDGARIASGSEDRTVRIWDVRVAEEPRMLWGSQRNVQEVVFSPDGQRIVSRDDETIRVWDAQTGEGVHALSIPGDQLMSYALSPDGRWIVCGSWKGIIRVWDAESGDVVPLGIDGCGPVWGVAFSPDGRRLLAAWGAPGYRLGLWDARTGEIHGDVRGEMGPHEGPGARMAFSPDGRQIAVSWGSEDNLILLWEPESRRVELLGAHPARGHLGTGIYALAFSPDGRHVVSGSEDKTLRVWDVAERRELRVILGHTDWVQEVVFSDDGRWIISGSVDGTVRVWEGETGACAGVIGGWGDVAAVARSLNDSQGLLPLAFAGTQETRFRSRNVVAAFAWFSPAPVRLLTRASSRTWCGTVGNHLHIFQLEGAGLEPLASGATEELGVETEQFRRFFAVRSDVIAEVEAEADVCAEALKAAVASHILRIEVDMWTPMLSAAIRRDEHDIGSHAENLRRLVIHLEKYECELSEALTFVSACRGLSLFQDNAARILASSECVSSGPKKSAKSYQTGTVRKGVGNAT